MSDIQKRVDKVCQERGLVADCNEYGPDPAFPEETAGMKANSVRILDGHANAADLRALADAMEPEPKTLEELLRQHALDYTFHIEEFRERKYIRFNVNGSCCWLSAQNLKKMLDALEPPPVYSENEDAEYILEKWQAEYPPPTVEQCLKNAALRLAEKALEPQEELQDRIVILEIENKRLREEYGAHQTKAAQNLWDLTGMRFEAAAAYEREACAKIADKVADGDTFSPPMLKYGAKKAADLIRARGTTQEKERNFDRERIELAKQALINTGYFEEHEVGDDIAPRITEYAMAMSERTLPPSLADIMIRATDIERENCAKLADAVASRWVGGTEHDAVQLTAQLIRARSNPPETAPPPSAYQRCEEPITPDALSRSFHEEQERIQDGFSSTIVDVRPNMPISAQDLKEVDEAVNRICRKLRDQAKPDDDLPSPDIVERTS